MNSVQNMEEQAKNLRVEKKYEESGNLFMKCAEQCSDYEAACYYIKAVEMLKYVSRNNAIDIMKKAIIILDENNKYSQLAKATMQLAEMYGNNGNYEESVNNYKIATNIYKKEESNTTANNCILEMADVLAIDYKYKEAIKNYEDVATYYSGDKLLIWSVKKIYTRLIICQFCDGDTDINPIYKENKLFNTTKNYQFLTELAHNIKTSNIDGYKKCIDEYNNGLKITDEWMDIMLFRIENNI